MLIQVNENLVINSDVIGIIKRTATSNKKCFTLTTTQGDSFQISERDFDCITHVLEIAKELLNVSELV